jgi:hypothetical protein
MVTTIKQRTTVEAGGRVALQSPELITILRRYEHCNPVIQL